MHLTKIFATLLTASVAASATAIPELRTRHQHEPNCKGSSQCKHHIRGTQDFTGAEKTTVLLEIRDALRYQMGKYRGLGDSVFDWGAHVVCRNVDQRGKPHCAFFQGASKEDKKTNYGGTMRDALAYVEQLIGLGCESCGSIPMDGFEGAEFTVNVISDWDHKCELLDQVDLCPPTIDTSVAQVWDKDSGEMWALKESLKYPWRST